MDPEITHLSEEKSRSLGRYQLLKQIGHGDTGAVWLGSDPHLHRQVAIKTLPPRAQGAQETLARFEHEVEAIAALSHPHILPIHDFGMQPLPDGRLITYFVMPYIAGGSLADLRVQQAREHRRLRVDNVLMLLSQVADALDYAHVQGVIHRNVKLANLLMHSEQWVFLTGFGIMASQQGDDVDWNKGQQNEYEWNRQEWEKEDRDKPEGRDKPDPYGVGGRDGDICDLAVVASLLLTNQHTLDAKARGRLPAELPSACKEVLLRGMGEGSGEGYLSAQAFVDALQEACSATLRGGKKQRVTRRLFLLGGTGAVAGISLWALSARSQMIQQQAKPRFDPDAPLLLLQEHHKAVQTLFWAPNTHVFVSASAEDAQIKLWDLAQLQPQQPTTFKSYLSRTWSGSNLVLAWSPDGTSLALASKEGTDADNTSHIVLLNPTPNGWDAGPEQSFLVPAPSVEGLAWSGPTLLVAAWNDPAHSNSPGYLGIWDTQQPDLTIQPVRMSEVFTPRTSLDPRCTLAVSRDGAHVALCTTNGALIGSTKITNNAVVWQPISSGLLQYQPGNDLNEVNALAWSAGGGSLLVLPKNGTRNALMAWILAENAKEPSLFPAPSTSTHFSAITVCPAPDTNMFAAGTDVGEIYLWNDDIANIPFRTLKNGGIQGKVLTLSWSFDGQWLAASYDDQKASILIWKL